MKRLLTVCIALAGISTLCSAQETDNWTTQVTFFTPSIVRVYKTGPDNPDTKQSLSVIMTPDQVKVSESADKNGAKIYKSSDLTVTVSGNDVTFQDKNGNVLLAENGCGHGIVAMTRPEYADIAVDQGFNLGADEPLYGLGILQDGKMIKSGTYKRMIQSNTEDYCNIIQSIKGYGLFWDNYSPTTFGIEEGKFFFTSENGGCIDYYFIWGGDADGVIAGIRQLTGTVPMVPLWSFGFMQSRERYKSSSELTGVLDRYRKDGVPIDVMIQDWQYWGNNYLWNAMEFNSDDFRNPERWIKHIHDQNAKLMISIWSSFGPMTKQYRELQPKGLLLDFHTWPQSGLGDWPPRMDYPSGVRPYDPYSKEARDIYWNHLTRLYDLKIDGWWMDSTEPDHHDFQESDLDLPTAMGTFRRVRNAFPLMAVGGVYDNQRAMDNGNDKRVLILTRSAFAGQQRYGSNTWSGDLQSNWNSLRNQIPAGLNFALTGNPNFNSDLGGFFASSYSESYMDDTAPKNPLYQELYVRWMQYGVFCPMMRSHGTEVNRELYYYGQAGEPVYDALLDAIKLRYSLLPYIYSLAHDVTANNGTYQRALMMDFRDDHNVWDIGNEFMFGRSLLVAPVLEAKYTPERAMSKSRAGIGDVDFMAPKTTKVYLPAGTVWYDFETMQQYDGGQEIEREVNIKSIPLFVKAGSIIPIGPDVQYSTEKPWNDLEILVYAGADGTFTLYEDEFDNYNYEKGAFSTIDFNYNNKSRQLTIEKRQGWYDGMIQVRKFRIVLIKDGKRSETKTVSYGGAKVKVSL
jgi:alpha-D-xyloside xylohydrolase